MKILAIFFLATLVGCYAYEACVEEKAESCLEKLLASLVDDSAVEEVCRELQNSIECLQDTVESCPGAEQDEDIKDAIDGLKALGSKNCEGNDLSPEEDEKIKKCFEENEDYIFECMFEGTAAAMEALGNEGDLENVDENLLQCGLYGLLTGCFIERIDEKCGAQAAAMAEKELSDLPDEIKEACDAVNGMDVPEFQLLEDRRKKK